MSSLLPKTGSFMKIEGTTAVPVHAYMGEGSEEKNMASWDIPSLFSIRGTSFCTPCLDRRQVVEEDTPGRLCPCSDGRKCSVTENCNPHHPGNILKGTSSRAFQKVGTYKSAPAVMAAVLKGMIQELHVGCEQTHDQRL